MADLIQAVSWPGVNAVASCTYVCGHGITPGRAVLTSYPQDDAPREYGDLIFTDGRRKFKVPACKVDSVTPQMGASGTTFTLEILDERWSWAFGGIDGHYNQKDDRGKLIPWTIRSPRELALLCLKAMGVKRFEINLPDGLTRAAGKNLDRYLKQGEYFPQSLTNPETFWDHIPPAQALAQLADFYGCRVIYQPNTQKVLITTPGKGKAFPNLPYESIGGTIDGPEAPAFVGVVGAAVKFQSRFLLEAVGEEWDGEILPIEDLSYSPRGGIVKQISEIRVNGNATDKMLGVYVTTPASKHGYYVSVPGFDEPADKFAKIRTYLLKYGDVAAELTIELIEPPDDAPPILRFSAKVEGEFQIETTFSEGEGKPSKPSSWCAPFVVRKPEVKQERWSDCKPPFFPTVQATNRLSYDEAKAKAVKSVFKWFRILNRDPHDREKLKEKGRPLEIAKWGKVLRRQQIVLLNSKVDQVLPQPRLQGAVQRGAGNLGFGALPDFYNGYSRDQPNTVKGSVYKFIGTVNWLFKANDPKAEEPGDNTGAEQRIFVEFEIDPKEQLVKFSEPVYYYAGEAPGGMTRVPLLTLEAGHYVLDPETNVPIRWLETLRVPGGTAPTQWAVREDVFVGVVGVYGPNDKLVGTDFDQLADARSRAGYYLRGMAAQYKISGGETRQYIGIVPHDPDGFCQQVSVSVGDSGPTTVVSGNTEHHPAIPPYPARRRAETLPADKAAAAANLAERAVLLGPMPAPLK